MLDYQKRVMTETREALDHEGTINGQQLTEFINLCEEYPEQISELRTFATITTQQFLDDYIFPERDNAQRLSWLAQRLFACLRTMVGLHPDWGVRATAEFNEIRDMAQKYLPQLKVSEK